MSENNDNSKDVFTPLLEAAVSTHELFVAYVEAGFSESQAMQLLVALMAASAQALQPPENPI